MAQTGLNRTSYFVFIHRLVLSIVAILIFTACGQGQQVARSGASSNTYSVSGVVLDDNGTPIEGATVMLHASDDSVAATTVSDLDGAYAFSGLPKGEYSVVTHHAGYQFATLSRTVSINQTSITGLTCVGTPTPGTGAGTGTVAGTSTFIIAGRVRDAANAPVSGVAIRLTGVATADTTTDVNGRYTFTALVAGAYTVTPTLQGQTFTPISRVVTLSRFSARAVNFTAAPVTTNTSTYSITGRVSTATGGLSGVTLALTGPSTGSVTSDANGNYTFASLVNGTYTITPNLTGYTFMPTSRTANVNNANVTNIAFVATANVTATYTLSGRVTKSDGTALSGVSVALTGAATQSATSDNNGNYSFTQLSAGNYVVTPALTGYNFTPVRQNVQIATANVTTIDFSGAPPQTATYSISGRVTTSTNVTVSGVSVALSGAANASVTTDTSGNYSFTALANGTYTITPTKNGYTFTPVNASVTVNGADVTNRNFSATPTTTPTYTISGQLTASNTALSGITVTLSGAASATVTSDANGNYSFVNLANGSYTVTPAKSVYTFSPAQIDVTVNGANVANTNFSGTPINIATYTVSGKITTGTTAGLDAVAVTLSGDANATATTDVSGNYSFANVIIGSYTVTPSKTGYTFSPASINIAVNGANIVNTNFTATATTTTTYSISGKIAEANGTAVSGVTVTQGTATTTTDANGDYTFSGLANGNYTLTPNLSGYSFTPPTTQVTINGANVSGTDFVATAPSPGIRNFTLYIKPGTLTVNGRGGTAIPAWSFTDVATTPKFPGAVLNVTEGDTVNVNVQNDHTIEHNFVINGITTTTGNVAAGASKVYTFTAANAGTYLYYDSLNNNINREMGLYGAIVVAPVSGGATAWTGGPAYTFQRLWVTGDMDKTRWNDVAASGGAVNAAVYKANYFLINGMGGEDAMLDKAKTAIDGRVGQTALVRILNAGQYPQTFHFHANHVQVISVNGVHRTAPYKLLDVLQVPPLGSTEVLFVLNQQGTYPMHNHTAQMETANGAYLNGVATMIYINP